MKKSIIYRLALAGYDSPCWLWERGKLRAGYGSITIKGHKAGVYHRFFWQVLFGELPDEILLHHLCPNKHCFNPSHLQPVHKSEHLAIHNTSTHCGTCGVLRTPDNTYYLKNGNVNRCKLCYKNGRKIR